MRKEFQQLTSSLFPSPGQFGVQVRTQCIAQQRHSVRGNRLAGVNFFDCLCPLWCDTFFFVAMLLLVAHWIKDCFPNPVKPPLI